METDTLVPLIFFSFLFAVIVTPILIKERTKRSAHALIGQAIERGQPLDPALVTQISQGALEQDRARKSLGSGVILLSIALGFAAAGLLMDRGDPQSGFFVPAVIAGSVGLAFVLLAIVDYASKKRAA